MTGHGQAENKTESIFVSAEVRSINNRYLKVNVRTNETYAGLEPRIEEIVRDKLRRGTIHVSLRIRRTLGADNFQLNLELLKSYQSQIGAIGEEAKLESLLLLPGVVSETQSEDVKLDKDWETIEAAVTKAIENLDSMRSQEGAAMAVDLGDNCDQLIQRVESISKLAPKVVQAYQQRLTEKISSIFEAHQVQPQSIDLIKEVGVYADRCDISEELVRLRSHLEQFKKIMSDKESQGRKLEFLTQEIFRETNTIGSKANDVEIAQDVVEMKTAVERIREMIQNVE